MGKHSTHIDLLKVLNKLCQQNENEILTLEECAEIVELIVVKYQFKIKAAILRKVEQSIYAAKNSGGNLEIHSILHIAHLYAQGQEGDSSFWNLFEETVTQYSSTMSDDQLMEALETLQDKGRRIFSQFSSVIDFEVKDRIPKLDINQTIRMLKVITKYRHNHEHWKAFSGRIIKPSGELEPLDKEQVLDICRAYNTGKRDKTKVWIFLYDRYLIGKGFLS